MNANQSLVASLISKLDRQVKLADATIADFGAKLAQDPHHAVSWGESFVRDVARRQAALTVKAWATKMAEDGAEAHAIIAAIRSGLTEEILRASRYPTRSTSVLSNFLSQEDLAARAELLEQLDVL